MVYKMKKSLRGLKQSLRAWSRRLAKVVKGLNLTTRKDPSIFSLLSLGKRILIVVYVDDIVIIGDDETGICDLKAYIQHKYYTSISKEVCT